MNEQPFPNDPGQNIAPSFPQLPPEPLKKSHRVRLIIIAAVILVVSFGVTLAAMKLIGNKGQKSFLTGNNKAAGLQDAPHSATFEQALARIASRYSIPEFDSTHKAGIQAAFDDLSQGFTINASAFSDDTTAMHAAGISALYKSDTANRDRYRAELYLLIANDLDSLPTGISDSTFVGASAQQNVIGILQKYQDSNLSKQVEDSATLQRILDTTATQLKLSKDKLAPYKIIAFGFENTDAKFDQLTSEHSLYGARPRMWTEKLDGTVYIMMFKSYANDVIAGKPGSLPHEFIHGQSPFVRGEAGRMIEERRAELFSGDTSAYYDAKQLVIYINVFADIDIYTLLQANPTDPAKLYADLYKNLGVTGTNALVFSWPNVYEGSDSKALNSIYALNNQDIAVQQALAHGKADTKALDTRVKQRYDKLMSALHSKDKIMSDLTNNLDQSYRMPTAAHYMIDYAKNH